MRGESCQRARKPAVPAVHVSCQREGIVKRSSRHRRPTRHSLRKGQGLRRLNQYPVRAARTAGKRQWPHGSATKMVQNVLVMYGGEVPVQTVCTGVTAMVTKESLPHGEGNNAARANNPGNVRALYG